MLSFSLWAKGQGQALPVGSHGNPLLFTPFSNLKKRLTTTLKGGDNVAAVVVVAVVVAATLDSWPELELVLITSLSDFQSLNSVALNQSLNLSGIGSNHSKKNRVKLDTRDMLGLKMKSIGQGFEPVMRGVQLTPNRHGFVFGAGIRLGRDLLENEKPRVEKVISGHLVGEVVKNFQVVAGIRSQVCTKGAKEGQTGSLWRAAHFVKTNSDLYQQWRVFFIP